MASHIEDSDDDLATAPSLDLTRINQHPPAERSKGRPAKGANKVAKSVATKPKATRGAKALRAPLKDTTNIHKGSDTEEVDDFDDLQGLSKAEDTIMPPKKNVGKSTKPSAPPAQGKKGGRPKKNPTPALVEIPETQPDALPESEHEISEGVAKPRGRRPKKESEQETKDDVARHDAPDPMEVDGAEFKKPDLPASRSEPVSSGLERATSRSVSRRRSGSIRPGGRPRAVVRGGSGSDTEGGDALIRQKLQDVTQKLESLEVKYNELRDVAVVEAETNFDKLKQTMDDRAKAADALIASLRKQLAEQTAKAKSIVALQTELEKTSAKVQASESEIKSLKTSVQNVQTENKSLSAKLAASRATSASQEVRQPGSAMKGSALKSNGRGGKDDATAKEAQKQLLKEDLYGDLSGLLIRDVRRDEDAGEDIYDCIQTGRNGSECSSRTEHSRFSANNVLSITFLPHRCQSCGRE